LKLLVCCQIPRYERKCWGAREIFSCAASDVLNHWRVTLDPEVTHLASPGSYASNRHAFRCGEHCAPGGREYRRPVSDRRSAHANARPVIAQSRWSSAPDNGPRRSPRNPGARFRQRSHRPVVDHQNINTSQSSQQTGQAGVGPRYRKITD